MRYYMRLGCSEGFGQNMKPKYAFYQFFLQPFMCQFLVRIHSTQWLSLRLVGGVVPV